jgi:hypothetical protein
MKTLFIKNNYSLSSSKWKLKFALIYNLNFSNFNYQQARMLTTLLL